MAIDLTVSGPPAHDDLAALRAKLWYPDVDGVLFDEAVRCFEQTAYRAALVMTWLAMRTAPGRMPATRTPGVRSSSRTMSPWPARSAGLASPDHTLAEPSDDGPFAERTHRASGGYASSRSVAEKSSPRHSSGSSASLATA